MNTNYTTDIANLRNDTDLFILAVNDDALEDVVCSISIKNVPIVHTSGSTPMDVFKPCGFQHYGIFYPVQSFQKNETESLEPIPICVEASDSKTEDLFISLAKSVSTKVYAMDSEKRKALHVAAVFANNFTNHLFHISSEILAKKQIPFDVIRPLVEKTADKIKHERPINVQTGPAVRNDKKVVDSHLHYLASHPEYQKIYELITADIFKAQNAQ